MLLKPKEYNPKDTVRKRIILLIIRIEIVAAKGDNGPAGRNGSFLSGHILHLPGMS